MNGNISNSVEEVGEVVEEEKEDWAKDCNDLRLIAVLAEAAVENERYEKAHEKLAELDEKLQEIREEYPR